MASKLSINCPFCDSKEVWDNRESKKGKQPDVRCTNKDCGAGGWIAKDKSTVSFSCDGEKEVVPFSNNTTKAANKTTSTAKHNNEINNVKQEVNPGFFSAWAKDLAVVSIEKDLVKVSTTDDVFKIFEGFYAKFDQFLNNTKAVAKSDKDNKEVVEENTSVEIDEDDLGLDDLDLDI